MHIYPRSPRGGGSFRPPLGFFFRQKKTARRCKNSLAIIILKYIPRVLAKTAKKFNKCGCSTVSKKVNSGHFCSNSLKLLVLWGKKAIKHTKTHWFDVFLFLFLHFILFQKNSVQFGHFFSDFRLSANLADNRGWRGVKSLKLP